jgi:G3E family GTPase
VGLVVGVCFVTGVIVNELGAVGIDGALLGGEGARQVELPGGCVCCVLGEALDRTLLDLVAQYPELEAIVLETTGVAEPPPIAWALEREPVASAVRLAAVITLVDATNLVAARPVSLAARGPIDAQLAYADVLLVTKSAIAGEAATAEAEAIATELAPRAELRRGTTDDHATWLEQVLSDPPLPDGREQVDLGHVHTAECRHLDSSHAHGIDSVWTSITGVVDLEELEDQLAQLPANYMRIKGIVEAVDGRVAGGLARPHWIAVHRVGLRVSSEPITSGGGLNVLVALGTGVRADELATCISAARVEASDLLHHS